ncbi:SRPBCC family protein, partial [Mycobacterium sp.]|uniref:SRPBCC family protein n=1 Tax=Mycobacterium sp. TaxID=1785 RepID=UPI003BAFDEDE
YWTVCRVTACDPGREFGFAVLVGDRAVNNWHYQLEPSGDGTDVTESFRMASSPMTDLYYWLFGGWLRQRRNVRDMTKTLLRIKDVAEA